MTDRSTLSKQATQGEWEVKHDGFSIYSGGRFICDTGDHPMTNQTTPDTDAVERFDTSPKAVNALSADMAKASRDHDQESEEARLLFDAHSMIIALAAENAKLKAAEVREGTYAEVEAQIERDLKSLGSLDQNDFYGHPVDYAYEQLFHLQGWVQAQAASIRAGGEG